MKYSIHIDIACSRDKVIDFLDNPDNLKQWQPELYTFEPVEGIPGQQGSKLKLVYQMNKRRVEIIETILVRNFPYELSASYETSGIWNRVDSRFIEQGDLTRWEFDSEFTASGWLRLLIWFVPWTFKKQSQQTLQRFKDVVEANNL